MTCGCFLNDVTVLFSYTNTHALLKKFYDQSSLKLTLKSRPVRAIHHGLSAEYELEENRKGTGFEDEYGAFAKPE